MLHYTICIDCDSMDSSGQVWAHGEIHSDLFAVCTCPKGHITIAGLMTDLFDVLYKSAVDSYIKGCLSESVMSFAAALERGYEQFTKTVLLSQSLTFDDIEKYWKEVKQQSERQFGSFCYCYFQVTNVSWHNDPKMVEFRNKVVHKGYIATSAEVKKYAEYVAGSLSKIIRVIKEKFDSQRNSLFFSQKKAAMTAIDAMLKKYPGSKFAASGNPSLLKWNYSDYEDVTFDESLQTAKDLIEKYGFNP